MWRHQGHGSLLRILIRIRIYHANQLYDACDWKNIDEIQKEKKEQQCSPFLFQSRTNLGNVLIGKMLLEVKLPPQVNRILGAGAPPQKNGKKKTKKNQLG